MKASLLPLALLVPAPAFASIKSEIPTEARLHPSYWSPVEVK